jgi:mannose-6-phosphate isomerase-like protein (cupin superfamily)
MARYTIVNLRQIDDMAKPYGMPPGIEARFARKPLELEQSGMSLFRLGPDFRLPFGHHHREQEEVYLVVSGSARMKIGDEVVELRAWDAVRVPADVKRGMEGGPDGAEILAFGAPSNDNRDAEMDPGFWPPAD